FHDLRHCFNCRLMEAGVLQEVRKALMGHSSGEDVHSTYVHVELPMKRDAIRKLEVWIRSQRQQLPQQGDDHETKGTPADDRRPAAIDTGGLPGASRGPAQADWRGCRMLARRQSPGSARGAGGS